MHRKDAERHQKHSSLSTVLSRLSRRRNTHARVSCAALDVPNENSGSSQADAGNGNICYENCETIDIPIVAAIMLRVRRAAPSCRFVSPSRFHKTGSMFIKHGIPGGTAQNFSRVSFRSTTETRRAQRIPRFYIGFNSYRDVLQFHQFHGKINDMAPHAVFEKFCSNTSGIGIQVSSFFFFICFLAFYFYPYEQRDCY